MKKIIPYALNKQHAAHPMLIFFLQKFPYIFHILTIPRVFFTE